MAVNYYKKIPRVNVTNKQTQKIFLTAFTNPNNLIHNDENALILAVSSRLLKALDQVTNKRNENKKENKCVASLHSLKKFCLESFNCIPQHAL